MPDSLVSIIVPTLNEAENLPVLVPRIAAAMGDAVYEVLIVDDQSRDRTPEVCEELSRRYPLRLIVREPKDGLSGAVLEGMRHSRGDRIVVMDADLQHPPEKVPELLAALDAGADFALGSRYVPGGSTAARWGAWRKLNSWGATFLARPFAGRTTDPMSGFFALRRATFEAAQRLTPLGYKIGLELMCKCRVRNVREVPIHFAQRHAGESKLTLAQQFRYLEHLSRLYDFTFPRASPIVKFLIATALAWVAGALGFAMLLAGGWSPEVSATLVYPMAVGVIALFHLRYVRTQREFLISPRPWRDFAWIAVAEWLTCVAIAWWGAARLRDPSPWEVFVLAFGGATLVRYVLRKELLQDVRGLRKELRPQDVF